MAANLVTVVHGNVCVVEVWMLAGGGEPSLVGRTPAVVVHLPSPIVARTVLRSKVNLSANSVNTSIVTLAPTFTAITSFATG